MSSKRHKERRETLAYWPARDVKKGEPVGLVSNLNDEGVQIHSKHSFRKGEILTIRIAVEPMLAGTDRITLVVENVWCRASGLSGLHHAGFKIVDISALARRSLSKLLESFSYPAPGGM